jgi:outer membrane autotransporter protein
MAPLTADAAPGAVQTLAGLRAGWTANPIEGLAVGPRFSVNYSRIDLDAYKEAGAGAFDLMVDGRVIDSLQVETAMEFSYQPLREDGSASPFAMFGRAGLVNEVGDGSDVVQARFAMAPDAPFSIARSLDRQWFSASTGFSYRVDQRTSLSLEASSDFGRDDFATTSLQLGFNRAF